MPCYHPLKAHQAKPGAKPTFGGPLTNIKLPCGRCIGCRLERSKQWAIRLMHEAQLHKENAFITLTFNDQHIGATPHVGTYGSLPPPSEIGRLTTPATEKTHAEAHAQQVSLRKRDAQLFVKRLRKHLTTKNPSTRIKFYLVGEYGEKTQRPHYHAAIFGEGFTAGRSAPRKTPSGETVWQHKELEQLWPYGYSSVGDLTFKSAAYIARYIMKKVNGKMADEHYKRENPLTGEIYYLLPEFNLMSRGGRNGHGIAKGWIDRYANTDVWPHDYVIMNGAKHKPPRYYDKLLEQVDRELSILQKLEREFSARSKAADNTPKRLAAKEKVAQARLNQSGRKL